MRAPGTRFTRRACGLLLLGCLGTAVSAKTPKLHLVCSGLETTEIIYGTELEPTRKGDFRVEYNIDVDRKAIAIPRNGRLTPINIDETEISFGSATDFKPAAQASAPRGDNNSGASATGVVINRKTGKYFSMATRKHFSEDPPAEGSTAEPVIVTHIRTRQGICTDGTPSPSF
jgi:hypothetical protein